MSKPRRPSTGKSTRPAGSAKGAAPAKGSAKGAAPAKGGAKEAAARPPARRGPPKLGAGPPVVGKRPSNPALLALVGLLWLAAAVAAYVGLHKSWKLIVIVVFAGIGLLYLRGAAGAYLRRSGGNQGPNKD